MGIGDLGRAGERARCLPVVEPAIDGERAAAHVAENIEGRQQRARVARARRQPARWRRAGECRDVEVKRPIRPGPPLHLHRTKLLPVIVGMQRERRDGPLVRAECGREAEVGDVGRPRLIRLPFHRRRRPFGRRSAGRVAAVREAA